VKKSPFNVFALNRNGAVEKALSANESVKGKQVFCRWVEDWGRNEWVAPWCLDFREPWSCWCWCEV